MRHPSERFQKRISDTLFKAKYCKEKNIISSTLSKNHGKSLLLQSQFISNNMATATLRIGKTFKAKDAHDLIEQCLQ